MPELNTKLIEACQRYINDPSEEREQAIRDLLLRWIPCRKRLPELKKQQYLVCTSSGDIALCRWFPKWFTNYPFEWEWLECDLEDQQVDGKVQAWMPTPLPYKVD
jgi:hypothetical protein